MADDNAPVAKKPWGWREIATFVVSYTIILSFIALTFYLIKQGLLKDNLLIYLFGTLTGAFVASYTYYVGTSQGSVSKDDAVIKKND